MWYIHFFPSASQNVYPSFPSLSPAASQGCGGSQPSYKNRTRYYGGISKWPVKNKGVPRSSSLELTPWPVFLWQLLFNVVGAKSVPDLRGTRRVPTHTGRTGRMLGKVELIPGARQEHLCSMRTFIWAAQDKHLNFDKLWKYVLF